MLHYHRHQDRGTKNTFQHLKYIILDLITGPKCHVLCYNEHLGKLVPNPKSFIHFSFKIWS